MPPPPTHPYLDAPRTLISTPSALLSYMAPLASLTRLECLSLNRVLPRVITSVIASMTQLKSLELGCIALQVPRSEGLRVKGDRLVASHSLFPDL